MPTGRVVSTRNLMLTVAVCMLPGLCLQTVLLDPVGTPVNLLTALVVALLCERLCLTLRGSKPGRRFTEDDASAVVTALILAAALPPGAVLPVALASLIAITLGKHAYGGLGNNVFNPAMVGYAAVLVSLPDALAIWPTAGTDGLTGATALTTFRHRGSATVADVWSVDNGFGVLGAASWEWIGLAYAAGGAWLFLRGYAAWRPAFGLIAMLAVLAALGWDGGSSASLGSPLFHLFSGGTLMAACFVATDPVTHPRDGRAQLIFGALAGTLIFAIRGWGSYPDGIAFAVLLANAATPYLDRIAVAQPDMDRG